MWRKVGCRLPSGISMTGRLRGGWLPDTAKVQRPAQTRPGIHGRRVDAIAGQDLVNLAVVRPLNAQVEARVTWQDEISEGQQQIARHRVDMFERQLARELPVGIEAFGVKDCIFSKRQPRRGQNTEQCKGPHSVRPASARAR